MASTNLPNILIVDDIPTNLLFLSTILTQLNIETIQATSGFEALDKIQDTELALAILDVQMPKMDGYELAEKIRSIAIHQYTPIIFLTAKNINEEQLIKGYDSGAVDYLTKPINSSIIISKVKIFINLYNQRKSLIINEFKLKKTSFEKIAIKKTLIKRDNQFKNIFDQSPIGICIFNKDGFIIEINNAFLEMFGISSIEQIKALNLFQTKKLLKQEGQKLRNGEIIKKEFIFDFSKADVLGSYSSRRTGKSCFDILISPFGSNINESPGYMVQILDTTERKQAEEALLINEEKLKISQKMGKMGYWEFDLKTQEIFWSDQVYELFERPKHLGPPNYDENMAYYLPEDSGYLQNAVKLSSKEGRSFKIDHQLITHKGKFVYHASTINPIKDKKGEIVKLVGTVQDITQRKHAELKIKRRLEFEKITSTISSRFVGLYDFDKAINLSLKDIGKYCEVSRAYLYQMDDDMKGMSNTHEWCNTGIESKVGILTNIPIESLLWFVNKLEKDQQIYIPDISALSEEAKVEREIMLSQDIQSLLMLPIYIDEQLMGFVGFNNIERAGKWTKEDFNLIKVFTHVLENALHRRQVRLELIESEKMYRTLLNASPDGIVITNLQGRISEISNIALELYGAENSQDLIGKHYMDFILPELRRKAAKTFSKTLVEGLIQNIEITLLRKDNTPFIGEISTTLIQESTGEPKAYMAIIRNVSRRKKMERQLIHAERMAGVGELAAGIAHEINQPLNTISLSLDNILQSLEDQTIDKKYLDKKTNKIFDNITRMKTIIDHIRTFSRDQNDFIQTTFDINESIRNALSMVGEQFKHKGIELIVNLEKDLPFPFGNTYKFEQVILNMLLNSKDALDEKKKKDSHLDKTIEIATFLSENQVYTYIADNGIGINKDDINNILLPFYTTKEEGKGTGLGLSISFGIIKEMKGKIEIQSEPNEGTTIIISLPLTEGNMN